MAYVYEWHTNFSSLAAADAGLDWTNVLIAPTLAVALDGGGNAFQGGWLSKTLTTSKARIVGYHVKPVTSDFTGQDLIVFSFNGTDVGKLRMLPSGLLQVLRGNTPLATETAPANALYADGKFVLEFGYFVDGAAGRIEVKINGQQQAALTSTALGGSVNNALNTDPGAGNINQVTIRTGGVSDWFWTAYDAAVWAAGNWSGSKRKTTVYATAEGHHRALTGWGPTLGSPADHSDCLDETLCDKDTSAIAKAVYAGNPTDKDSVLCDTMPGNATGVWMLTHWRVSRKESSVTAAKTRGLVRLGVTDYNGAETSENNSYSVKRDTMRKSPATAADWDIATEVNVIDIGTELTQLV